MGRVSARPESFRRILADLAGRPDAAAKEVHRVEEFSGRQPICLQSTHLAPSGDHGADVRASSGVRIAEAIK
jgi:hypothetical protein